MFFFLFSVFSFSTFICYVRSLILISMLFIFSTYVQSIWKSFVCSMCTLQTTAKIKSMPWMHQSLLRVWRKYCAISQRWMYVWYGLALISYLMRFNAISFTLNTSYYFYLCFQWNTGTARDAYMKLIISYTHLIHDFKVNCLQSISRVARECEIGCKMWIFDIQRDGRVGESRTSKQAEREAAISIVLTMKERDCRVAQVNFPQFQQ